MTEVVVISRIWKLFAPKRKIEIPPMPEITAHLRDKGLKNFSDEVARVLYSADGTKRLVILRSNRGFHKVVYERIEVLSEEEWQYFCRDKNGYPAYWLMENDSISLYASMETAIKELQAHPENKIYFASKDEEAR